MKKQATTIHYSLILLLFFLAFYWQDRYAIAYVDDYPYAFMVTEQATNYLSVVDDGAERVPVTSLADAVVSQSRDYFKSNGRFVIHTLVQFFCGTMSIERFALFNSVVFALFTLLFLRLAGWRKGLFELLALLSVIWLLMPHKGLVFFGNISNTVNYLWTGTATLLFLLLYERLPQRAVSPLLLAAAALFSVVTGSLQESFSICISGALVLMLLARRHELNRTQVILTAAYVVGAMVCVLSPANFNRVESNGGIGFNYHVLMGLLASPPFLLVVAAAVVLWVKGLWRQACQRHLFYVAAIVIDLAFMCAIAYNGRHQLTVLNVLCLLLLIRLGRDYGIARMAWARYAALAIIIVSVLSYLPILHVRKTYHDTFQALVEQVRQSTDGTAYTHDFDTLTEKIRRWPLLDGYYVSTFTISDWDFYQRSLSIYLTRGRSNSLIRRVVK